MSDSLYRSHYLLLSIVRQPDESKTKGRKKETNKRREMKRREMKRRENEREEKDRDRYGHRARTIQKERRIDKERKKSLTKDTQNNSHCFQS